MKFPKTPKWLLPAAAVAAVFLVNPGPMDLQRGLVRGVIAAVVYGSFAYFGTKVGVLVSAAVLYIFVIRKEGMEGMEGKAIEGTECPDKFTFDVGAQMCKGPDGAMVKPTQVVCESGYKPNDTNDKCVQDVPPPSPAPPPPAPPAGQEPPPPPASSTGSPAANAAAPTNMPEPFTGGSGTVATTPGAAQDKAKETVVLQQQGGTTEPFSGGMGYYPLQ